MQNKVFTSSLLSVDQMDELFARADESKAYDKLIGEHADATVIDYLMWANEEVVPNADYYAD